MVVDAQVLPKSQPPVKKVVVVVSYILIIGIKRKPLSFIIDKESSKEGPLFTEMNLIECSALAGFTDI